MCASNKKKKHYVSFSHHNTGDTVPLVGLPLERLHMTVSNIIKNVLHIVEQEHCAIKVTLVLPVDDMRRL